MKLETNNLNAEFYLASLALGVLEAMKQGVVILKWVFGH